MLKLNVIGDVKVLSNTLYDSVVWNIPILSSLGLISANFSGEELTRGSKPSEEVGMSYSHLDNRENTVSYRKLAGPNSILLRCWMRAARWSEKNGGTSK